MKANQSDCLKWQDHSVVTISILEPSGVESFSFIFVSFFLLRLSIKFKYWISSSSISSTSRNNYSMYMAWFHYMPSVLNVFFLSGIMRFVYDSAWTLNIHSQLHGKPSREENCAFRLTGREMLRGKFHQNISSYVLLHLIFRSFIYGSLVKQFSRMRK